MSLNIALVSDMFYPGRGGVETHILELAHAFIKLNHNVIVITHKYKNYSGIVYIDKIKVYYLNIPILARNVAWPCLYTGINLYKQIFIENKINVVHGHQTHSPMALEAIFHANFLGIKTVLTEHSIYDLDKLESYFADYVIKYTLLDIDKIICVSNVCKQNILDRFSIFTEDRIKVIPNGVNNEIFKIKKRNRYDNSQRICIITRFEIRKGIDLLLESIPMLCKNKRIKITIVGDGTKKDELLFMIDEKQLHDQVEIFNFMSHEEVAEIMRDSDVLLNTSLTESFCMTVVEATMCGLAVVTTNVGGINELKTNKNVFYCKPEANDIVDQVEKAIQTKLTGEIIFINEYDWNNIAAELINIYKEEKLIKNPGCYKKYKKHFNILLLIFLFIEKLILGK